MKSCLITILLLFLTVTALAQTQSSDCVAGAIRTTTGIVPAQNYCTNSQTTSVSGTAITITNNMRDVTTTFEEKITGSPATISVVIQGCMTGGTCDTLDTYTTVANANRKPTISSVYDYYTVTPTWTGGTSPSFTVNTTITQARSSSTGGGSGNVTGPASATLNDLPIFSDTTGKLLADSGTLYTNLVTESANAAGSGNVMQSAGANKTVSDSGVAVANVPTQASNGANLQIASYTGANKALTAKSLGDLDSTLYAVGGGTAQAQTVTLSPAVTALTAGLYVHWLPVAANTSFGPTLAVNGLTATTITKCGSTALIANDLTTSAVAVALYDGTQFQLLNPQNGFCGTTFASTPRNLVGGQHAIPHSHRHLEQRNCSFY